MISAIEQRKKLRHELNTCQLPKDVVFFIKQYEELSNDETWRATLFVETLGEVALHWFKQSYGDYTMPTITKSNNLISEKQQLFGVTHVKGFKIIIRNRSGYGGFYHQELDWSFHAYGSCYSELIENIAKQYYKHIRANRGTFEDFEIGGYDIETAHYMVYGDMLYIDENFESVDINIDMTTEQIKMDIESSETYKALSSVDK